MQIVLMFLILEITIILTAPVDHFYSENMLLFVDPSNMQDLQVAEAQHTSLYGYNSDRYPNYPHVFGGYPFDYSKTTRSLLMYEY